MSIESAQDLKALKRVGRIVRLTLAATRRALRSGIRTAELDRVAANLFKKHGARSAPKLVYGFPGTILISVNDAVVHGIPGDYVVQPDDLRRGLRGGQRSPADRGKIPLHPGPHPGFLWRQCQRHPRQLRPRRRRGNQNLSSLSTQSQSLNRIYIYIKQPYILYSSRVIFFLLIPLFLSIFDAHHRNQPNNALSYRA